MLVFMKSKHWPLWLLLGLLLLILLLTMTVTMSLENRPAMQRFAVAGTSPAASLEWQQTETKVQRLMEANDLPAAENLLLQMLSQHPDKKDGWMQLGIVSYRMGKFPQSEQAFRHILRQQPNNAAAYNNLSLTLLQLQRTAEAEQAIRHAIQLEPKNGEIQLNAASFYAQQDQDIIALNHLQKAINNGITPERISTYRELVQLLEQPENLNYYQQLQHRNSQPQSN